MTTGPVIGDEGSERAVISACLLRPDALPDVLALLGAEEFYWPAHQWVFRAITELDAGGVAPDLVTVASWLREHERLDQVGGAPFLAEIADATPAVANLEHHARIVAGLARRRRVVAEAKAIAAEGGLEVAASETWCDDAVARLADVADSRAADDTLCTAAEAVGAVQATLSQRARGEVPPPGCTTGYKTLDHKLLGGGLRRKCQYVLGGRPGHGKTALALQIACHVANQPDKAVVFFSLEMPREQLVTRALAQDSGLDGGSIERAELGPREWSSLSGSIQWFAKLNLVIDDRHAATIEHVRTGARRALAKLRREKNNPDLRLALIVVDYIQIMKGVRNKGDSREAEVAGLSKQLTWIAKELDCATLVMSQLKRGGELRKNKPPTMEDLRESGALEQDAYGIMLLHRPEAETDHNTDTTEASLRVAKHRQGGRCGTVGMRFHGPASRFLEAEGIEYSDDPGPPPDYDEYEPGF